MKFYWAPKTRSSRVAWLLEEAEVAYERVVIDIRDPGSKPADFLAASPMGKVPAIRDGDVAMAESAAIGIYVADRHAPGRLAPAIDAPERGRYLYWMVYTPGVLEPAMGEKLSGSAANRLSHGWGDWPSMIETLERALAGRDWLLDSGFSAADVMVGSSVVFLQLFGMLPASPMLEAYAQRCLARPAYQRALALEPEEAS